MFRSLTMTIGGRSSQPVQDQLNLVGRAEEERAVDAEYRDERREFLVLQNVRPSSLEIVRCHERHGGRRRHPADVKQRGEDHADLDRHGQVREDRETEGDRPRR